MKPEEREELLSAYVDGELDELARARAEEALKADPAAKRVLEDYAALGESLRAELEERAGMQNYSAMEDAVLARLGLSEQAAGDHAAREPAAAEAAPATPRAIELGRPTLADLFRQLLSRPAISFALGALVVAGAWSVSVRVTGPPPSGTATTAVADRAPGPELRGPEPEQSFARVAPSLLVDSLDVEHGKVILATQPDDPDAPVVLWHLSNSEEPGGKPAHGADQPTPAPSQHPETNPL